MYKIMIVDDEEKIREVIREYAEFNDYQVIEACDGMEAVNLCRTDTPDLIIMDIMMPRLDGFSACNLKTSPPSCSLPGAKNTISCSASSWGSMTM